MEVALLIARLFLAVIFGIAGVAKLADLPGSSRALLGFGVPQRLARLGGVLLPVAEILIALALVPRPSAWWGAVFALALLVVFASVTAVSVARGLAPDCHCFGQFYSSRANWSTVARDVSLAVVAGFVAAAGRDTSGASVWEWLADVRADSVSGSLLLVAGIGLVLALTVLLLKVLYQQKALVEKIETLENMIGTGQETSLDEGLPVGAPAPEFSTEGEGGGTTSLGDLLAKGRPALLLFVSPTCPPCRVLLPLVEAWESDRGDRISLGLLSKGNPQDDGDEMAEYGARNLVFLGDSDAAEAYRVKWTPAAVLVNGKGRIASRLAYGEEGVREILDDIFATLQEPPLTPTGADEHGYLPRTTLGNSTLAIGDPAPRLVLENLEGAEAGLKELLGRETLVLFWNNGCGFCQGMIEDVKQLETSPPNGINQLLFVVSGDVEVAKAAQQDFASPSLFDPEMDVAPLFGSHGTPSAVLIDKDGKIASDLAVGAGNVLALAGFHPKKPPPAPNQF